MSRKHRDPSPVARRPRNRSRSISLREPLTRLESRLMPAVITPFSVRFGTNANGDIAFVANTLMTAPDRESGAANARAGVGTKLNNNDFSMAYVDIDSDASTFNSSRADLALPRGATVLFAGLYWGAESSSANRNRVLFQTPGSAGYTTVTGSIVGSQSTGDYHAFADVTAAVRAAGVGTYGVANVQANIGADKEAGWSMVIAYGDPSAPPRNLTVFDGFAVVDTKTPNVTIPISGFKAPLSGAVKASLGFITYEGDRGYNGDALKFNGSTLSDAQNPADNFLNSTISNRGVPVTTRSPNYANQFGLDADIIATSGLIANGATSATINLTTDNETYYPGVVTTAIDLYAPVVEATKTVADLNGGVVSPGDVLEYTDTVRITSGEAGTNVVLSIPLPDGTRYVPGSLAIGSGANAGPKTDAAGDDQADYQMATGRLTVRLGTGATSSAGGTIAVGGSTTVTYRVIVAETTPDNTVIAAQSAISLSGQSTGASLSASTSVSSVTVIEAADLSLSQTASNLTPNVGDLVTLAIDLANNNPNLAGGVVVNDLLPTGLVYQSATATVGSYNPLTGVWTVGTLDGAARLTIVARVVATSAVVNTATIAASGRPDLVPANNTSQLTITPLRADLGLTKAVGDNRPYVGQRVTFVTTLTNLGPDASANVVISDRLPAGFSLVSAVASVGTYDPATGRWTIATIGGTPATLTLTADVTSASASIATATVLSASTYDPTPANNTASVAVTPRTVDLAVAKTVDKPRPNVGDVVVLTTRVSNGGTGAATGVRLLSAAGSGLTILSAVAGQGTFDTATGVWVVGGLASESEAVLRVTARVDSPDAIASAAGISQADQPDIAPNNDAASVGIVPQKADLATTQAVSNAAPLVGDEVDFTITLGNAGPDAATNVRVRDVLPAGLLFLSATPTLGNYDPTTGMWTAGTVPSGTLNYLTIRARVTAPAATTNTASIFASDQYDPNPANNAATATSTPQQADLSLASAFDQARPNVNAVVQYRVTVTAPGPGTATGVAISAPLPGGLAFISAIPEAGTYDQATGTWTVGTVAPGTPITLTILGQVVGIGSIAASASISGLDQFDPSASNNTAVASLTTQRSDLAVASVLSDATPNVGDTITLRVTVTNAGDDPATNVAIANSLPAGLTLATAQGPGTYDLATGTWAVGTIAPGGEATLVLRLSVVAPTSGDVVASVQGVDQYDPVKANNNASTFLVTRQAGLSLGASVDQARPNVGDLVTFVVTLNNSGPDASTGARIAAALPAGLRFQDATPSQGTYSARTGTWSVGTLAGEGSASLTIRAIVTGGDPATLAASILGADQFDPAAADDVASATVTPLRSDLVLTVGAYPAQPIVGEAISFLVRVRNFGPDDATNVRIATSVPVELVLLMEEVGLGTYDRATGVWTIPSVVFGDEVTMVITYEGAAPSPADFAAAIVASDQFDPTPEDRSGSAVITPARADLGLAAAVDVPNPGANQVVTFTFTLTNFGPDAATGASVAVPIPAGYAFVDSSAIGGSYNSETGLWTVGNVIPGTPAVLTLRARVVSVAPPPLTATIAGANQADPAPGNDAASAFVRPRRVDLVVGNVVSDPIPNVGDTITLTISVFNSGPDAATGVVLKDILPAGLAYTSSAGQGAYDSATGLWTVGSVAPGDEATLTLTVIVTDPDAMINRAEVQAVDQFDVASANDAAETSIEPQQAELRLTNRVDDPSPLVGDVVTFTVSLKNLGIDATTGVVVAVPLPAGLSFVSASAGLGTYDSETGLWTVGTLASGDSAVLILRVLVAEPGAATVVATIDEADQFDPNPNDNEAGATIEPQSSDVGLSFAIDAERPDVGAVITVTLDLRNRGGDEATGVRVGVPLPAGLAYVADTPDLGSFDAATGTWTVGTLAAGSSTRLTLRLRVVSADPIPIKATVVALDQSDPVADDNAISAVVTPRFADLGLAMTADDVTPDVGDVVTFTLVLSNSGPDAASGVRVADALPSGLVFDSAAPGQGTFDPATGTWQVGTLASGSSATLVLRARVASPSPITYTATIAPSDRFDPDATNGTRSVTLTPKQADLSVSIVSTEARPNVGDEVVLTITVANDGPDDANNASLLVALPAGLEPIFASPAQGTFSASSGLWSVGTVPAGATLTLQVRARVVAAGTQVATVGIDSADEFDPSAANDGASVSITPQVADLSVAASVDNDRPNVGDTVTIAVTVSNTGPDAASGIRIDAILPAGLVYVSDTADGGSYDAISGAWTLGTLAPGASRTLRVVARVAEAGSITPTASVALVDQFDPTEANDASTATIIPQQADLGLLAVVDNARPNVGDLVTFTMTLTDSGPDPAAGVRVLGLLPAGLSFVSADPDGGAYDPITGTWTVGVAQPGTPRVLRLVARVVSAAPATLSARILGADQFDPEPGNDAAIASITPQQADLSVTTSVDVARPDAGTLVTITVTVSNSGPDAATGVRVAALLPAGLAFVSAEPDAGTYDQATGTWAVGGVDSETPRVLRIVARVEAPGPFAPTASIAGVDQSDPTSEGNTGSTTIAPRLADLSLAASVDAPSANVGDLVTFTVTVANAGPDSASGVRVVAALPAGLEYVSSSSDGESYDPATGTWLVGGISSEAPRTLRIVARVASPGRRTFTATVAQLGQFDPTAANNSASVAVTPPTADLSVSTTVDNARPNVGDLVTITVTLTDVGAPATGVAVSAALPAGLAFVSATPDAGTYDPATGTWTAGTVNPSSPRVLRLVARVVAPGVVSPSASVLAVDQFDPTPGNNAGSTTVAPRKAHLTLTQSVDNPAPNAGEVVTITLTLTNAGPDPATNVSILSLLPEGLELVSAEAGAGGFDPATGLWSIASVEPGAPLTLQVRARVARAGAATITSRIRSSDQHDPSPDGREASTTVAPRGVDLSVRVEGLPPTIVVGQRIDLRVIASNRGPDGATGVRIPIALPPGFRLVSAVPGQGSYDAASGVWLAGPIPAGGSAVLALAIEAIAAGDQALSAGPVGSDQFDASAADDVARSGIVATPAAPAAGTSSLGGRIFDDLDGDGVQDPGESGRAGVPVVLEGTDAEGNPVRLVAITADDGSYFFVGLRAGVYSLVLGAGDGSPGVVGSLGGRATGGRIDGIVLGEGDAGVGYAFAAASAARPPVGPSAPPAGRVAGVVYLDRNRNGVYDPGLDFGIATIRVILTGVDDQGRTIRIATTTDATGAYQFEGLRPGTYSVQDGRTRFFRVIPAVGSSRARVSSQAVAAVAVEAGVTSQVDFAKMPVAGCRLIPLMGPGGIKRPVPRGPLFQRFFPTVSGTLLSRSALRVGNVRRAAADRGLGPGTA
ncbi:SdrD B-like domain-containing protein [Tundrisphaera sp. TA3]|uniref:SdrD B-like domain-containing protein n=1 Tax=Tundrisphaera sp. TA3 TaxID=3435775 RepID=UPI003EB92366